MFVEKKNVMLVYESKLRQLREFFERCGMRRAVVAMSGGIDSAVVLALAVSALGRENIRVLMLPSRYSSDHSVQDSLDMIDRLHVKGEVVNIDRIFDESLRSMGEMSDLENEQLAADNIQARIRCMVTMALCNATGALMLNTSNRSEILVGYGTLYGDTSGAVAVIGDLYKDQVYALARYINAVQRDVIPNNIIRKAPSAELHPGQLDSDSLPDYKILDGVLRLLVDNRLSVEQIIARGYQRSDVETIVALRKSNSFKALQLPPVLGS